MKPNYLLPPPPGGRKRKNCPAIEERTMKNLCSFIVFGRKKRHSSSMSTCLVFDLGKYSEMINFLLFESKGSETGTGLR